MIRLLIADDHPVVREGLKHVVSQYRDIEVVGEAENAETTLQACTNAAPDVLLLDVSMPGPGVLELIALLKSIRAQLRILVLSVHPQEHYARRVLKAGADGYLTKNQSPQALASAIRHVHSGRKYVSASLAEELALDLDQSRERRTHEALSNREFEVFLRLGAGKSVEQIAQQLQIRPKTVRTYRSRIFEKMNFKSTAELIFYAVHNGLVTEMSDRLQPSGSPGLRGSRSGSPRSARESRLPANPVKYSPSRGRRP
jgi:DNA-binding NarL/FixJ family response regulator